MNDHASSDDRQISHEGTLSAKSAKDLEITRDNRQKDIGRQVIGIINSQWNTASLCRVSNDLQENSCKSIDELLPRIRLAL
jgi:hypothetical protein